MDLEAALAQECDGLERQHAVGAATVSNDRAVPWKLPQTALQFAQRDIHRLGQVTGSVFVLGPHIEHGHEAIRQALYEFRTRYRLQRVALVEIAADDVAYLGGIALSNAAQGRRQLKHRFIAVPIENAFAVAPRGQQSGAAHQPQTAGMRILYVLDTHIHADHVSAGRRLADAAGAPYVLFAGAEATLPFQGMRDRSVLPLGNVVAEVLHTPGHTPEHVSLLVTDRTRANEPWFVLTGHTLMVGDVGRTELATTADEGARVLFRSLQRLKALPEYVEVLPGAFSGSVCGRRLSGKPASTIGFERRYNAAFRIDDESTFVQFMREDVPVPPPRAAELRRINAGPMAA